MFGDPLASDAPHWGWFLFGCWVLLGLLCGATCGHLAHPRGRPAAAWFAAGFVFNVIAVAALLAGPRPIGAAPPGLGRIPGTAAPEACPGCGAANHPLARRCAGCGRTLAPVSTSEAARESERRVPGGGGR